MSLPDEASIALQREVERLFHDLMYHRHPASHFTDAAWSPPADVVICAEAARVLFELAGVPREQVRLRLVGRQLEVSGRRQPPHEPGASRYHRAEIYFGDFRRVVELPWPADPNNVEAVYRDGMLEVTLRPAPSEAHTEIPVEDRGRRGG